MKKVVGGEDLINGLMYLSKNSDNGYAEYELGNRKSYIFFSPELIEKVFINNQKSFSRGITFLKIKNFFGNGLLTSEDPDHINNKRIIQKSFHKNNYDFFLNKTYNIINKIFENLNNKTSLTEIADEFTLTAVSSCFFSNELKKDYIPVYHEMSDQATNTPYLIFKEKDMKKFNAMKEEIGSFLKNKNTENNDLIKIMIDSGMSEEQVLEETLTIIGAGFETTAALLCWSLIHLSDNKKILDELREDTPDWIKENRHPNIDELFNNDLINKVIKETLRTNPPGYFTTRQTNEDLYINNLNIRKGTNIFFSQYVAHRNELYYNDAEIWNPYRWTEEFEKSLPKGAYFPFGHGSKKCIGDQFAKCLIIMFISLFIYRYNYYLLEEKPKPKYLVSMIPDGKIFINISDRV